MQPCDPMEPLVNRLTSCMSDNPIEVPLNVARQAYLRQNAKKPHGLHIFQTNLSAKP